MDKSGDRLKEINMSSSTVHICENNNNLVEIKRTFSSAFLLLEKDWKPPVIRGYELGQPTMEILLASEPGQKLIV